MVDISVIVPVYNAEKYLRDCLESLVNQTKQSVEVVAVDDGSTDGSLSILNEYAEKYPNRFKVVAQKNQGQSVARNSGIKISEGKYLAFIDSDDEIELDLLERLWKKVEEYPYDVVAFDVNCIYPDKNMVVKSGVQSDNRELSKFEKSDYLRNMYGMSCNKIYKRAFFDDEKLLFVPGTWFEDVLFLYKLIPNVKSIATIDYPGYKYYQRENSVTYTYSDKLKDINGILEKMLDYYMEEGLYEEYKQELEYIYVRYMFATYIKRLAKSKDKVRFKEGIGYAKECVQKRFPDYKKNVYLNGKGFKNLYLKNFNSFFANMIYHLEKNKMN